MKIVVLGTRGFPNIQGGVESHCEQLYTHLADKDCEIIVFARKPYVSLDSEMYKGVRLIPLRCPKNKFFEAFIHTLVGIFAAKNIGPDILHIHAIGPSLFIPLARLLDMKVVMTNHGPDYNRSKWGRIAKVVLKCGEILGVKWANEVICISKYIAADIEKRYKKKVVTIPNGVEIPELLKTEEALAKYGLERNKYILTVGRFVKEKGFHDLIDAFNLINIPNWKLVIVGDSDHEDAYSLMLKKRALASEGIILTGKLSGKYLQELYSHAGLFTLPSYYEGLPIVLLEAMSYGLSCIVSDIPANREVDLPDENYFRAGDIIALSEKISIFISKSMSKEEKHKQINMVAARYNWDDIAEQTLNVYKKVISK